MQGLPVTVLVFFLILQDFIRSKLDFFFNENVLAFHVESQDTYIV